MNVAIYELDKVVIFKRTTMRYGFVDVEKDIYLGVLGYLVGKLVSFHAWPVFLNQEG